MSTAATWFGIYVGIGLVLMTVALATDKRMRCLASSLDQGTAPTELSAWFLIFVALLWPVWLLWVLVKEK